MEVFLGRSGELMAKQTSLQHRPSVQVMSSAFVQQLHLLYMPNMPGTLNAESRSLLADADCKLSARSNSIQLDLRLYQRRQSLMVSRYLQGCSSNGTLLS